MKSIKFSEHGAQLTIHDGLAMQKYSYEVGRVVGQHAGDLTQGCIANISMNPTLTAAFLRHRPDIVAKLPPVNCPPVPLTQNSFWIGFYHARNQR